MKILYVTPSYLGAEDVIMNITENYTGLPPFVKALQGLREKGHQIDFVIVDTKDKKDLYLKECNENITFLEWESEGFKRLTAPLKLFFKLNSIIKNNNYDFIYGHGSIGALVSIVANYHNIPVGQRLYGAYPILKNIKNKKSTLSIFLRQPLYYMSFKLKKDFLIVTNDGTQGDYVYKKLNKYKQSNFDFYCWTNGVDDLFYNRELDVDENFIFYPGRISPQKQQLKVLNVIKSLKDKGCNIKFYFAGQKDKGYAEEVEKSIKDNGLEENVVYLGTMKREELAYLYKNSIATLLLYDISSRGNTALEALKCGSVIITYNNNGLNEFILNGENGFLVDNEEEIPNIIINLFNNKERLYAMRKKSKEVADLKLESWDERISKEINLIEKVINKNENKGSCK